MGVMLTTASPSVLSVVAPDRKNTVCCPSWMMPWSSVSSQPVMGISTLTGSLALPKMSGRRSVANCVGMPSLPTVGSTASLIPAP
jgi:hypothetical protein